MLDGSKLKVDSDQAIQIATSQPVLENLKLKATQLWLEHGDNGPQWRVKLWAARLKNPDERCGYRRGDSFGRLTVRSSNWTCIRTALIDPPYGLATRLCRRYSVFQ